MFELTNVVEKSSQTTHNSYTFHILPYIHCISDVDGQQFDEYAPLALQISDPNRPILSVDSIMKHRILLIATLTFGVTSTLTGQAQSAPKRNCRTVNCCPQPASKVSRRTQVCRTSASGPTTKWFKAKDGTIREVMTHWDALHRAVDADNMEIELRAKVAELDATRAELASVKEASAAKVASLEQQLAEVKSQFEAQKKATQDQNERANVAEAAHKASEAKVASLVEAGKKAETTLANVQKDLQQTMVDRDALKAANDKLQAEMKSVAEARAKADDAMKAAQEELAKMKQEAIESRKAEVATRETEKGDGAEPVEEVTEEKPVEAPVAEEPTN